MTGRVSQQIVPQQITVRVVRETDNALPAYETAHSAGLDLRAHLEEALLLAQRILISAAFPTRLANRFGQLPAGSLKLPERLLTAFFRALDRFLSELLGCIPKAVASRLYGTRLRAALIGHTPELSGLLGKLASLFAKALAFPTRLRLLTGLRAC